MHVQYVRVTDIYLHHQASRRQILWYLCAVVTLSKHWCIVVHIRHIDDYHSNVAEGRFAAASFHRQVVLSENLKVQRSYECQKAWKPQGTEYRM